MVVREARVDDLARIEHLQVYEGGGKVIAVADILGKEDWEVAVATVSGRLVGFGVLQFEKWNNLAWIKKVVISSDLRLADGADMLIDYLVELSSKKEVRSVVAEVSSQHPLKMVYEEKGFRGCGYNDRYFNNAGQKSLVFFSKDLN